MRYGSILETIGNTPLVQLKSFSPHPGVEIYAKLEGANPTGSIKDRIAKQMIEDAEAHGRIKSDSILIEPTSGNTGIALAMICRVKGYPFVAVMPDNVTQERRKMLELYGAKIIFSEGAKGSNGAVRIRAHTIIILPSKSFRICLTWMSLWRVSVQVAHSQVMPDA